ncbi:MAG: LON peptidase substrate-binding domain-containing protein, partial [Oscillospiraceae bacterium]
MKNVFKIGVVAHIKQLLKADKNTIRVLVEGEYKAKIESITEESPFFVANVKRINKSTKKTCDENEQLALVRLVKDIFAKYCQELPNVPKELVFNIKGEENPEKLFNAIVSNILIGFENKQQLLEINNSFEALKALTEILQRETEILSLEQDIYEKVRSQMDQNQRDYYLREQQKIISYELNGDDDDNNCDEFKFKIMATRNISDENRLKLLKECDKLARLPDGSQEANVIQTYLETVLELPFDESSKDQLDIKKAQKRLDNDHYGLTKVKERILELLSVRQLSPDVKGQIICLVGPPGVGKTSIASSIAKAINRKYVRLSLGGVRDESDIRGHRKTYIGAMPGRIINALKQAKTNNPLILLDEIDKMGNDFRGDPASAMLEV